METDIKNTLAAYAAAVEDAFGKYVPEHTGEANEILYKAMRYSFYAGGKRIRPALTLAFCEACGGRPEDALPFACAIEAIHTYSLIHDDLPCMDDDALRRGQPTCHKAFGEANALLAGDGLLTAAFGIAASNKAIPAERTARAVIALSLAAGPEGMVGGQIIDLALESEDTPSEEALREMYGRKTGALLRIACVCGCIAAGADENLIHAADEYALSLGLAFQIIDDILDVTGNVDQLGKETGHDQKTGKRTLAAVLGIEAARILATEQTERAITALGAFGEAEKIGFLRKLAVELLHRNH